MKSLVSVILVSLILGSLGGAAAAYYQYGSWRPQYLFGKPIARSTDAPSSDPTGAARTLRARASIEGDSVFDFGVMSRNEKRSHVFVIRNRGNIPLKLTFLDKSCQCTEVQLSKTEVEPDGTSKVTLTWQPSTFKRDFQQTARFQTNDPARVELDLTVKGQVQQIVEIIPPTISWDGIVHGQSPTTTFDLIGYRDQPMAVSRVEFLDETTADYFSAEIQPLTPEDLRPIPHAVSGSRVILRLREGLPIGRFAQRVRVHTNQNDLEPLELPIQGTIAGNITFVGSDFDRTQGIWNLGTLAPSSEPKTLWLLVPARESESLEIRVAGVDPSEALEITLTDRTTTGNRVKQGLQLKTIPVGHTVNRLGTADGPLGKITLETNHPDMPRIEIPVAFASE